MKLKLTDMLSEIISRNNTFRDGLTFKELIDAVYSNEKVYNKNTVMKVYNEITRSQEKDAQHMLKVHMKDILKELED